MREVRREERMLGGRVEPLVERRARARAGRDVEHGYLNVGAAEERREPESPDRGKAGERGALLQDAADREFRLRLEATLPAAGGERCFARHGALGGLSVADFYSLLRFVPEPKRQEFAARSMTCAPAPVTSHRGAQRRELACVECLATVRFILVQRGSAASRGRRRRTRPDPSSNSDIRDDTPGLQTP